MIRKFSVEFRIVAKINLGQHVLEMIVFVGGDNWYYYYHFLGNNFLDQTGISGLISYI